MAVAVNFALERRIELLERKSLGEPIRIVTKFRVCARGDEVLCQTAEDAYRLAKLDPVIEVVDELDDLDVLIDTTTGARVFRRPGQDDEFDELAASVREIVVIISCHEGQLAQIISDAPITATVGGTRAGKTRVLVWWLFRQWLKRGHGVDEDHELPAVFWWVREDSTKLWKHAVQWIERLWPGEVFVGKRPTKSQIEKSHALVDGSVLAYKHAAHSGKGAGKSLRSESVEALVVDELSAVHDEENWREMKSRVAQTAGPIATAYTPTAGHWVEELEKASPASGGAIVVKLITMFDNPWWPFARIWVDLLKDAALTAVELEEKVLGKPDQARAARTAVTDPHVLRMRWGVSAPVGIRLWRKWDSAKYVVRDQEYARDALRVGHTRLTNITAAAVGAHFGSRGRAIQFAGGKDFNVNPGVTILYQVFGARREPHVLIFDEVSSIGPTCVNAEAVKERYPGLCMFCDPTGAMDYRHASHGSMNSTDAEEMRQWGLGCESANGERAGKAVHLPQLDSINVLHRAMSRGLVHVHARCTGTLRALARMQAKQDGRIHKVSGTASISDQISAYGDAMRYGLWPVYEVLLGPGSPIAYGRRG